MTDILPGDVVVCVSKDKPTSPSRVADLVVGRYYRVIKTRITEKGYFVIGLAEFPADDGKHWHFFHWRFRKIRPADPEFIEQIRVKEVKRG